MEVEEVGEEGTEDLRGVGWGFFRDNRRRSWEGDIHFSPFSAGDLVKVCVSRVRASKMRGV